MVLALKSLIQSWIISSSSGCSSVVMETVDVSFVVAVVVIVVVVFVDDATVLASVLSPPDSVIGWLLANQV